MSSSCCWPSSSSSPRTGSARPHEQANTVQGPPMSSLPDSPPERISTPAGEQPAELRQRLAALSPEKQALLEQRLLARRAVREPPAIVPREDRALAPLS